MSQSPPHHLLGGVMLRDYAALLAETRRWPAGEQPPEAWMRRVRESATEARRREGEAPAPAFKADLPVLARREEIAAAIRAHPVVVIAGETGSGKTTQLPQICLSLGRGVRGMIGHTQPRRLAARAVAARLADELGGAGERAVGYKIRFGDRTTASTMVKVMTDGVLLAETHDDPDLWAYDTIIIDEAHERSLNIDFLLGYLRRLSARRPDLRIIVTSATIDPARFSEFFGGAPVLEVSGRAYPVEVRYRVPGHDDDETPEVDEQAVADAVEELTSPALPPGDVLVFLPGEREIRSCARTLERRLAGQDLELLPLFSRLSNEEQDRIFRPGKRRRVILATNVAETSLTVPGIRHVVDTGLARLDRYDPRARVQRLLVEPISQASCNQRSGRCGRQSAGVCIRLFSKSSFDRRARFTDPEIRRTNLASVILRMKALGLPPPGAATADEEEFPFLDRPEAPALRDGYATLFELGATPSLEPRAPLTALGERLARIPADPRTARILLAGADEGCLREALILAAGMSVQDPRERPQGRQPQADAAHEVFRHPGSDFLTLLNMWDQYEHQAEAGTHGALRDWCRAASLSAARMREWQEVLQQLRRLCGELGLRETGAAPASEDAVHRAMLTGLLGNVCCRAGEGGSFEYAGPRGARVSIFPGSVLFKKAPKWIVAAEIVETTRLYARTVGRIEPEWIEELGGHVLTVTHSDEHYDAQAGAAMAWERVTLSGVVVVPRRKAPLARTNPALARRLFVERALASGELVSDAPFAIHNRALLARAQAAEARVRTRNLLAPLGERAAWFEARLPAEVYDAASLEAWLARSPAAEQDVLRLSQANVLSEKAAGALDEARYPATLALARGRPALALEYRFEPGKEADGITATVALTDLPAIDADRAAWLVPGWLPEIVHALLKHLPREHRERLESPTCGPLPKAAAEIAGLVSFGAGALPAALSEAAEVLTGARVPLEAWRLSAVPEYLRLRLRVVDDHGKEIASERDIAALQTRLAARAQRAIAAGLRSAFERENVTEWDFPDPPEEISVEQEGGAAALYPAVLDMGGSVTLTLLEESGPARAATALGVRRLFALAARDELHARLDSLAAWPDLVRWHNALGTTEELREAMCALICERAFLSGEQPPRTREAFEAIRERHWGRLSQATMEAAEMVAKILEPRAKVAHRLSGGTSRNWAASVADMREHAAYLMPRGFLGRLPWERLREYPRYAEGLRARLFRLREEGSPAETQALAVFLPNWKRFTAWVVQAISREKALSEASPSGSKQAKVTRGKAPLPQSRRAAPTVNLDAGEWALTPGILPPAVAGYRWALEEYRLVLFAPDLAGKGVTQKQIDELWGRVSGT
jgi:ATP-dependent helicase HrpA